MSSGKAFNDTAQKCDFYVTTINADDNVSEHYFANIRYVFDLDIYGGTFSEEHKFIHLVEIPDDAEIIFGVFSYKSTKLNIKKTWTIEEFKNYNETRIRMMESNRNLFDEFDDVNHMYKYNLL